MKHSNIRTFSYLLTFLLIICFVSGAYSDGTAPPKCIGDVCLFQHIDEIETKIYGFGKQNFGPLAFLKDDGLFVSTGADKIETMNWVGLASCGQDKIIKNIHRVIKDEKGREFERLLSEYELKYGSGEDSGYVPRDQKWAQWRWKEGTDLALIWNGRLNTVSIDLNYDDPDGNNDKCMRR